MKRTTLLDIEEMTCRVARAPLGGVDIWLAKDLGSQFFKDTYIVSLLAQAARRNVHARVIDWIDNPGMQHVMERFGRTLEGLATLEYAHSIVDARKATLDPSLRQQRFAVVKKNGISTIETASGKSLTFCAFDPDFPTPVGFAGIQSKKDFAAKFIRYRKECFEVGIGEGFSDTVSPNTDRAIADFAYEIWQNSFQHGRLDEHNNDIRGMRYLRVHKHIGYDKKQFLSRAAGFPELHAYLACQVPLRGTYKFYEIAIGDCGIGIVERLLATRPDLAEKLRLSSSRGLLLNRIISEALSSKRTQSGAGHGLENAMRAVRELRGFISLRSGSAWLYYDSHEDKGREAIPVLSDVTHHENLCSVGTQVSLLFPLVGALRK